MKIQQKLTTLSISTFAVVYIVVSVLLYFFFVNRTRENTYKDLGITANTAALFYLEQDEMNKELFTGIKEKFQTLNPTQHIHILNTSLKAVFNTSEPTELSENELRDILIHGEKRIESQHYFYYGTFYRDNQGDFIILVRTSNVFYSNQQQTLLLSLSLTLLIAVLLLGVLSKKLAEIAYKPVNNVIKQVNDIAINKETVLLNYPETKDELEDLFKAFNKLLKEAKQSYDIQKNFVDHASHELKTPLTTAINELEVLTNKERTVVDYQQGIQGVKEDLHRMNAILYNLLLISGFNKSVHEKTTERVDELVWETIAILSKNYKNTFKVSLILDSIDSHLLEYHCNKTQLQLALLNVFENAAKFSKGKEVTVILEKKNQQLVMQIIDNGVGIPSEALEHILQPFYRASNAYVISGNGLGLTMASAIFDLHHITYTIKSMPEKGTTVTLTF